MGIPTIYPPFVMSEEHARLAIPVQTLAAQEFELDVLGLNQTPLLTASLGGAEGARSIEISLHSVDRVIAIVTAELQILTGERTVVGTISRDGATTKHVFKDSSGTPCLVLAPHGEGGGMRMFSPAARGEVELASVARRPPGRLPAEHYELVVGPNVDAVVPLACFLAMAVFVLPELQASPPGSERRVLTSARGLPASGVQGQRDACQQLPLPVPPPPPFQGHTRRSQGVLGAPGVPTTPSVASGVSR